MTRYFTDDDIPGIGLGTWENVKPDVCKKAVETALSVGYRHVDTAQIYKNEAAVGEGLKSSNVPRDKIFLATKLWIKNLDYQAVINSTQESLKRLKTDYVDCLYVHWPAGKYRAEETFKALKKIKQKGLAKKLGVSNFTIPLIEELFELDGVSIYANQVEMHPFLQQQPMQEYLRKKGIYLVAYSPFRHGTIFSEAGELEELAGRHDCSIAQLVLAWLIAREGVITIPKASSYEHIEENFKALEIELTENDIKQIERLDRGDRFVDPPFSAW